MPYRTIQNVIDGGVLTFTDISEVKKLETSLKVSEKRLQELFGHMLIAFDNRQRTVAWNRECERVTGYLAGEMLGNSDAFRLLSRGKRNAVGHDDSPLGDRSVEERSITCKDGSERRIATFEMAQDIPLTGWAQCLVGLDLSNRETG